MANAATPPLPGARSASDVHGRAPRQALACHPHRICHPRRVGPGGVRFRDRAGRPAASGIGVPGLALDVASGDRRRVAARGGRSDRGADAGLACRHRPGPGPRGRAPFAGADASNPADCRSDADLRHHSHCAADPRRDTRNVGAAARDSRRHTSNIGAAGRDSHNDGRDPCPDACAGNSRPDAWRTLLAGQSGTAVDNSEADAASDGSSRAHSDRRLGHGDGNVEPPRAPCQVRRSPQLLGLHRPAGRQPVQHRPLLRCSAHPRRRDEPDPGSAAAAPCRPEGPRPHADSLISGGRHTALDALESLVGRATRRPSHGRATC